MVSDRICHGLSSTSGRKSRTLHVTRTSSFQELPLSPTNDGNFKDSLCDQ